MGDARLHLGGRASLSRSVLRAAVTQRSTPISFIIVTYIFIGVTTFGWRLVRARTALGAQPRREHRLRVS